MQTQKVGSSASRIFWHGLKLLGKPHYEENLTNNRGLFLKYFAK